MCFITFVSFSVLCFGELPEYFKLYYESSHEGCPPAVSVVPPEMPPEDSDMWLIEAEVLLGKNCNYTVIVVSHNGAGETNSSGVFSISKSLQCSVSACV